MGGGFGKGLEDFYSKEEAEKWRKETFRIMSEELQRRGIRLQDYSKWKAAYKWIGWVTVVCVIILLIWLASKWL